MVRLKDVDDYKIINPDTFQFLMVRLKEGRALIIRACQMVSIPYGTIKRKLALDRLSVQLNSFNSLWYD